ncbi:MAG: CRTAC1 family protein, partial [Planctomycetes bacterium]|nr:CRTAC1 family protein [Planctomycetota bacterium]
MPARHLRTRAVLVLGFFGLIALAIGVGLRDGNRTTRPRGNSDGDPDPGPDLKYQPRKPVPIGGFDLVSRLAKPWDPKAPLAEVARSWVRPGRDLLDALDRNPPPFGTPPAEAMPYHLTKVMAHLYEGEPDRAYEAATDARGAAAATVATAEEWTYTFVYLQAVCALRRGEDENCIMCRGESSCILPVAAAAVHTNPAGSRAALKHLTEYLARFPDDLGARWLLNLAHMTLGEHPGGVDPRFVLTLDTFVRSEFDIGRFRDVGHRTGLNRLNNAGGVILDDFDGDGRLDVIFTSMDPTKPMAYYWNKGDGTFEDRTAAAGLADQLGGLNCVQTDYNNDGFPDVFVCRGAWLKVPMRPSLLRNNGNGTFTDVTERAGLAAPVNTIAAQWADFDNDGHLDVFVCCETGPNKLYRNSGDGTFTDVAGTAGVAGADGAVCKGAAWLDYDGDRYPDLFLNNILGPAQLFRNNRDGTFTDVTAAAGIAGPEMGFSCWAWDYDNDGRPDLFATSYARDPAAVIRSLRGEPHGLPTGRLYRNVGGTRFADATTAAGLDGAYAAMGSNFGDLDGDGFLDFYLGTGDPNLDLLVPNRMFKNVGGTRFADVTGTSGTGNLQKGHGVAIGDWDRNGTADLLIQMGGAIPGDKYHNLLFQNPGQGNHWLNLKLVGTKTNRAAIGVRIKVVTAGPNPQTVYRTVCSGSSFGANPLEQHIGLGKADRVQCCCHLGLAELVRDWRVRAFASAELRFRWSIRGCRMVRSPRT